MQSSWQAIDYSKYPTDLTGYTGRTFSEWALCAGTTQLHPVRRTWQLQAAWPEWLTVSGNRRVQGQRRNRPAKRSFLIHVYESRDDGLSWNEIGRTLSMARSRRWPLCLTAHS